MHLEQFQSGINRIKVVIRKLLEDSKTIRIDKTKKPKEIVMEKIMLEGRIKIIKFRDNLNGLEEDIKQEIKLLKKKKIRIRTSTNYDTSRDINKRNIRSLYHI